MSVLKKIASTGNYFQHIKKSCILTMGKGRCFLHEGKGYHITLSENPIFRLDKPPGGRGSKKRRGSLFIH